MVLPLIHVRRLYARAVTHPFPNPLMYDTSLEMKTSPADIEPSLGEDDSVTTLSPSMSSTSLVSNPNLTARMAEEKQPEHLQEDVSYHPRFYIRGSMIDIRVGSR
jgi:hypothetical protein